MDITINSTNQTYGFMENTMNAAQDYYEASRPLIYEAISLLWSAVGTIYCAWELSAARSERRYPSYSTVSVFCLPALKNLATLINTPISAECVDAFVKRQFYQNGICMIPAVKHSWPDQQMSDMAKLVPTNRCLANGEEEWAMRSCTDSLRAENGTWSNAAKILEMYDNQKKILEECPTWAGTLRSLDLLA